MTIESVQSVYRGMVDTPSLHTALPREEIRPHMVNPFTPRDIKMAELFTRGYTFAALAGEVYLSPKTITNMFTSLRMSQALGYKIYRSAGVELDGSAQIAIWMCKMKYIPVVVESILDSSDASQFLPIQTRIMEAYLSGITRMNSLADVIGKSEQVVKNYLNGAPDSISRTIERITAKQWYPPNTVSAGFWMVRHGLIDPTRIGRNLPDRNSTE